jgi:potassium efflux system protein
MNRSTLPACSVAVRIQKELATPKLSNRLMLWTLFLIVAFASIIFAQQKVNPAGEPIDVTRRNLQSLRQKTESDKSLDAQTREEILKLCDEGIKSISAAENFSAQAARYEREGDSIPRLIKSLERQLLSASAVQEIAVPESATVADVRQLLQQSGAELAARRDAVQAILQSASERNIRRTEISRRAAALDQQIYELDSSIESTVETTSQSLLRDATLANLAARRHASQQEIRALNAELTDLNLRNPLRILRRQRAERRVMEAVQRQNRLEEILGSKVNAEIKENLSRLQRESADALEKYPNLKPLTDEILNIANQLFGPEGVEKSAEPLTAELNALREAHRKAAQVMEVARDKYAALGSRAELQRWFPVMPAGVPPRHDLERQIEQRAIRLADANATLVGLQDRRANLPDLDTELAMLLASLKPAADENEEIERQSLSRQLLLTRTELLDRLVSRYTEYYSRLKDVDTASRELLGELDRGYQFTLERIFWRRSIAGPLIPAAGDIAGAVQWLFANPEWPASISRSLHGLYNSSWVTIFFLIMLVLLITNRKRFEQRLARTEELANESNKPLRPLLESALLTILLAAPLPLAMAGLGLFLSSPQPAPVAEKFSDALLRSTWLILGLELIVQIFRERGFAQTQFAWSTEQCRKIRHEVRLLMLIFIPSSLLFMSFGVKPADHVGDPLRIAYLESLGRIAFIVCLLAVALTSLRLYRWLLREGKRSFVRFPGSILLVLAATCLFSDLLSILGWHLSAFVLAVLVLRSFFLILDVALVTAFIERLRQIRGRVLRERKSWQLDEQDSESKEESEVVAIADESINLESTNRQVGESIRLGAIVITILGLYMIWSAQLPSLRFMERVQLLPTMQILPMDQHITQDTATGSPLPSQQAAPASAATPGSAVQPADSSLQDRIPEAGRGYSLTLAGLLGAIAILLFLVVLAKYIPSLLDFIVLSRFRIVSGDRKAITTIVSYILVIIGLSAAAAKMGLKWSQVQWLAAAFSFGLGFGLQDIFANFFSGLVLLFERPMRVGDFCRFGDQLGTVEAIGLRSTKVRGLDRTVINVPNADFSKKELINYAKRDRMLLKTIIGLRYETSDEQLRYVLAKIRELLLSHPKITEDPARVRFVGYGDFSLNIEIFAYAIAQDWGEFLGIQEDVFLRIMRIIEESGTGFAFPSQTTYLARDGGLDAERTASAEAEVEAWRSEQKLPFPDFSERQRRQFRDSLDYPPAGSPYSSLPPGPSNIKKGGDDKKP